MSAQLQTPRSLPRRFISGVWKALRGVVFSVGLMFIVSVVMLTLAIGKIARPVDAPLPQKIVLTYTVKDSLGENAGRPSLSRPLLLPDMTVAEVVRTLDRASRDPRVAGLVVKLDDMSLSFAAVQELRAAVTRFTAAGKNAGIFSTSYGGMSQGIGDYYLATAFKDIWLQPVGFVSIGGIGVEMPFLRGFLDKIGITPDFAHKGKYKSGAESLTHSGFSPEAHENMVALLGDLSAQVMTDIEKARGFRTEELSALSARSPLTDREAVQEKLVTRLGYADEMLEAALAAGGDPAASADKKSAMKAEAVTLAVYARKTAPKNTAATLQAMKEALDETSGDKNSTEEKNQKPAAVKPESENTAEAAVKTPKPPAVKPAHPKIAVITAVGEIAAGAADTGFGEGGITPAKIVTALEAARKNRDVVAVVLRIDSPGGAPDAAESIRRAVLRVKMAGKPVVVSMGGYAASGGYWIAAAASHIVAQPATITGSIGVFGGKFALNGLYEKLGISVNAITFGGNAAMWSPSRPFNETERATYDKLLQSIYDGFISRVAAGRNMKIDEVKEIAEGRVYTGRQALAVKLVDELGGFDTAIAAAKRLAGIDNAADLPLVNYPPKRGPVENLLLMAAGDETVSLPDGFSIEALARAIVRAVMVEAGIAAGTATPAPQAILPARVQ